MPRARGDARESSTDSLDSLVEEVAQVVRSVPGVHALHGGAFGEIATYLPGRRVAGLRVGDDVEPWEIHVSVVWEPDLARPLGEIAQAVRDAVAPLAGPSTQVDVVVEDVVDPSAGSDSAEEPS